MTLLSATPLPTLPSARVGLGAGISAGVLAALVGAGSLGWAVLTPSVIAGSEVALQVTDVVEGAVGAAPTDLVCPSVLPVRPGLDATCTGTVEGRPTAFLVHVEDRWGGVTVSFDRGVDARGAHHIVVG